MRYWHIITLISYLIVGAALSQDAAEDAGSAEDAGEQTTRPGAGAKNKRVVEDYTADHGCRCSTVGAGHSDRGWLTALALAGVVAARSLRRRQQLSRQRMRCLL